MNPLFTERWRIPSLAVVTVLLVMAVLTACAPSLGVGDIALALEATGSTPDAEATRAVATFAAALAAPPPFGADETPTATPMPTVTPTETPTPTETAAPTKTPRPTRTPNVAATETSLRQEIERAVAATLAAQPTATPQPTATWTPQPPVTAPPTLDGAQMIGVVVGGGLINLRSGPGLDYAVLAGVDSGEEVLILGRSQDAAWLQVRTAGGLLGWMSALYVSTVQTPDSYPVLGYPGR